MYDTLQILNLVRRDGRKYMIARYERRVRKNISRRSLLLYCKVLVIKVMIEGVIRRC